MNLEKLISRHRLDNGLTLELWDQSRSMPGDRWQVIVEVRLTIPVGAATLSPDLPARQADIIRALGPEIVFSQRHERTFIEAGKFQETIQEIEQRLLRQVKPYLSHPEFARRFIRKRYGELLEKRRWSGQQTLT